MKAQFVNRREPLDDEVKLWAVGTGTVKPWLKKSREAATFITMLDGFVAVHIPDEYHVAWLFDSEEHAKKAMEDMHEVGIETGKGIGEVFAKKEYLERGKK